MSWVTSPLSALYEPIREDLAAVTRAFDVEIMSEVPFIDELCQAIRSYRGKMLRPVLLLLSGKAVGEINQAHHTLGAVVEMVHMATLVHDDVLDDADERRRQPTISSVRGNVAAVLLGDYLISHAYHLCSSLPTPYAARQIGATTNTVCEGELLQNYYRNATDLTETQYLEMISSKTAALIATACELGAYYAGADVTTASALRAYGEAAGTAFQIVDDVLDLIGTPNQVGKSLDRDLSHGKTTLPAIHAMVHAQPSVSSSIQAMIAGKMHYDGAWLKECLQSTGSFDYAMTVAGEYVANAHRQLGLVPPGDARDSLTAVAEFVIQRKF